MEYEVLPFAAQFTEVPTMKVIDVPEYDPSTQTSLNFCPCGDTGTYDLTCTRSAAAYSTLTAQPMYACDADDDFVDTDTGCC